MTDTKHLYIVAALIILALLGHAYITSVRNTATAETTSQLSEEMRKQWQADLKEALAVIAKDKQEVKTPQQVVQKIPQYIELPKPIYIQGPSPAIASTPDQLPDAPSAVKGDLVIPQESASAFFQFAADCKANTLKLNECQKELPLVTKERDAWKTAAKGGSFWSRVKSNAKWLGIGAGLGAAAGYAATH